MSTCRSLLLVRHPLPQQEHLHQGHHNVAQLLPMTTAVRKMQPTRRMPQRQRRERVIWGYPTNVVHPSRHHVLHHHLPEKLPLQRTTMLVSHLPPHPHVHDLSIQDVLALQIHASYRSQATRAMVMMCLLRWVLLEQGKLVPTA